MGIHGLSKVVGDNASAAIKDNPIKHYFGRKIAIDASMSLYQFLIAVRQEGHVLTTDTGETTSHLLGFFYRTIRMIENGIKPVYVFDGKPPTLKSGELAKRAERRAEAQKELDKAQEQGDTEGVEKFTKRLVKVTPEHNSEVKRLLGLMGVPYVEAPCEAEAQCAAMVKEGVVYATATEDMDALTFGSTVLLRNLTASESRKLPVREIHLDRILSELDMTQEEFVDLCILLGCDYCDSIRGIGPVKATSLVKQYKSIDKIVEVIKREGKKGYQIPDEWCYQEARTLFASPEITDPSTLDLKWRLPDEEGLVQFLVEEKGFSEDRVRNGAKKLCKSKQTSTQGRMDSFFKAVPSPSAQTKRKTLDSHSKGPAKKKAKTSGSGRGRC